MVFKCDAKMARFSALPRLGSLPNTSSNLDEAFGTALPQTKKKTKWHQMYEVRVVSVTVMGWRVFV